VKVSVESAPGGSGKAPGPDEAEAWIRLAIKPGWHVYANKPGAASAEAATRVSLEPGQGLTVVHAVYPDGVLKTLAATGAEKVSLYEGDVLIRVRLKREPSAAADLADRPIRFSVAYQACNDRACLAPARAKVELRPAR
jgi:DsbC/DsbD-like thiol-disulfide interchange protein